MTLMCHFFNPFFSEVDDNFNIHDGNSLVEAELVDIIDSGEVGRGGHPRVHWEITEAGKVWRSDIGRFIQLGQKMGEYPRSFFFLPSDEL